MNSLSLHLSKVMNTQRIFRIRKLISFIIGSIDKYSAALNARASSKIEAIHQLQSPMINCRAGSNNQVPEYAQKLKTLSSIPAHLQGMFPSKLAVMEDKTLADREGNPSHERMQKVQYKREVENVIQDIANISEAE